MILRFDTEDPVLTGPWFRAHPRRSVLVAVVLFIVVFLWRDMAAESEEVSTVLFVLPVALIAMSFGRIGAVAAGVVSSLLTAGWGLLDVIDLSVVGWLLWSFSLLLVGLLIGDASERLVAADGLRAAAGVAKVRQAEAAEINDSLIQGMVAAKWQLEASRSSDALQILDETIEQGQRMVSDLLRQADSEPRSR